VTAFLAHLGTALRLHFRNRLALIYGYLFPLLFLATFWVLYRHEKVPLLRHVGELLTLGVLGGACFGLPTTLVGERERGLWRRYRLTPVPVGTLIASTVAARFLILLSAGLLQIAVALLLGMTAPAHWPALAITFTLTALAFIGLGLVIAMLADNVPAVQALGQCLFLPMLVIGGIAVPLGSLPEWAQQLSGFFPGRYAVESMQAATTGDGLAGQGFSCLALIVTGVTGATTGALLFRWDAGPIPGGRARKWRALPVLLAWVAVGLAAEARTRTAPAAPPAAPVATAPAPAAPVPPWVRITSADVAALDYRIPPDSGVVAPWAGPDEIPDDYAQQHIDRVGRGLPAWPPGRMADDLESVRHLLCVAAVPDVLQLPSERFLPQVVLDHLRERYRRDQLVKMLAWIAQHPEQGTVLTEISGLGIPGEVGQEAVVRERSYFYAIKFIARLTGRTP